MSEEASGSSRLTRLDVKTGKDVAGAGVTFPESIGAGGQAMNISAAKNGNITLIRSSYEHAPEVWAGPAEHMKQITHLNDALKPAWGED